MGIHDSRPIPEWFGDAMFIAPETGNFDLNKRSNAVKIGFEPFKTDNFGVKNQKLRTIAKRPEIPTLFLGPDLSKSVLMDRLGAKIKTICNMAERSAAGLNKTAGVLIESLKENSTLKRSGIQVGDVIIGSEGKETNTISDLMKSYQSHNWKGMMNLVVFRNQRPNPIRIATK